MVCLKKQREGDVLTLQMDVLENRNALSRDMQQEILEGVRAGQAEGCRVAVLKGLPTVFSSGYNISPVGRTDYVSEGTVFSDVERLRDNVDFLLRLRRFQMPILSQVRGYCLAGATDLMLATDVAVVADNALIGVPNVRSFGISLLSTVWPILIGPMRAKLMMFTGDSITGAQASQWGLVGMSVPEASLDATVMALAQRMALMPPDLLAASKLAANRLLEVAGLDQLVQSAIELDVLAHCSDSVVDCWKKVRSEGLRTVLKERDARYAHGGLSSLIEAGTPVI